MGWKKLSSNIGNDNGRRAHAIVRNQMEKGRAEYGDTYLHDDPLADALEEIGDVFNYLIWARAQREAVHRLLAQAEYYLAQEDKTTEALAIIRKAMDVNNGEDD